MSGFAREGDLSKGLDASPTPLTYKIQATKTFVNGKKIALVGDQFEPHTIGLVTHSGAQREIISGSSKTFFEGKPAARAGDPVADGDQVGDNVSNNTFIE